MGTQSGAPLGDHVRRWRLAAGFSQEALAARAGLSVGAIRALERGRRTSPHPTTLRALAEALGLGPEQRATLIATAGAPARPARASAAPAAVRPARHDAATLPIPPTALIGRAHEVATIGALVREGGAACSRWSVPAAWARPAWRSRSPRAGRSALPTM